MLTFPNAHAPCRCTLASQHGRILQLEAYSKTGHPRAELFSQFLAQALNADLHVCYMCRDGGIETLFAPSL